MSVLEIILYVLLGTGTLTYAIIVICKFARRKNKKPKDNDDED